MNWLARAYAYVANTDAREDWAAEAFTLEKHMIITLAACEAENPATMANPRARAIVARTLALDDYPPPVDAAERTRVVGWLREFFDLQHVPGNYSRTLGTTLRAWYGLSPDARIVPPGGDEEEALARLAARAMQLFAASSPAPAGPLDALRGRFDVDHEVAMASARIDAAAELDATGVLDHTALFPPKGVVSPATHEQVKAEVVANLRLRRVQWEGEMAQVRGRELGDDERRAALREFLVKAAADRAKGDDSLKLWRAERAALA
ncbi:hypothetical protein Q8F55_006073 [Vanrija albida]|uniref:Uncharacterized protein n=1 Tax=Vanrija albida TaxID=181172 RepID=A0ABR3Q3C2_9TREE